jgi:hypothetical protein
LSSHPDRLDLARGYGVWTGVIAGVISVSEGILGLIEWLELADRREISSTHALRQAIQTELLIQRLIDEGANFVVQPEDGQVERLVFAQAAPRQRRGATA